MNLILSLLLVNAAAQAESDWPGWRGPEANGHSREKGLPTRWTPESVAWKTPLEGSGHSSPVIWGNRLFLTTALEKGRKRVVICVDRTTGKIEWKQTAWTGVPEDSHAHNGWASATCATDGERVYAFFGRGGGLHCYSMEGRKLWARDLGEFKSPWGTAACPVLVGDLVIQNCDADQDARIRAFDKKTGKPVWNVRRPDFRGWSTPVLVNTGSRRELVVNGHTGVTAYAPETGEQLWHCKAPKGRGTPTVTPANKLLYVLNGLGGGGCYAIRPGGSGDVTGSHRVWLTRRGGRDTPSPIVIGDTVLALSYREPMKLTAYDAASGKMRWEEDLSNVGASGSPISHSGLGFFVRNSGETLVVDPEKKIIARNSIGASNGELFRASPTPSDGQIFIRSDRMLYCVGKRKSSGD